MDSTSPFHADALTCALALCGKATPTPAQLTAALQELYPVGPTVADLLTTGQLVHTIDGQRLRLPPFDDAKISPPLTQPDGIPPPTALTSPLFSYYVGGILTTTPHAAITPAQLYAVLTSPRHRATTQAIRTAPKGSSQRADLKKQLDYVTPAGTFTRRANTALEKLSGLLVLDFDHLPNLGAARAALLADKMMAPELVLLFTSPSGDGLKALMKADPNAAHLDTFRAYAGYLSYHYTSLGLCPDEAGKDLARACFVPYAPDAWLAPVYASLA